VVRTARLSREILLETNDQRQQISSDVDAIIKELKAESTLPAGGILESHLLVDDLGLDSISVMEFISMLTEKYDVDIDLEDVQHCRSVGDVIDFVQPLVKAA